MYAIIINNGMEMMLLGTIFTAIAVPVNNRIIGVYNRRINRKMRLQY